MPLNVLLVAAMLALPAVLPPPGEPAPTGCREQEGSWLCQWSVKLTQTATSTSRQIDFPIPVFPLTMATVHVRQDGLDGGWRVALHEVSPTGEERELSKSEHQAWPRDALSQQESTTHAFAVTPGHAYVLAFWPDYYAMAGMASWNEGPPAPADYLLTYRAESIPPGLTPARPAATRDDPHLQEAAGNVKQPERDLVAAWFDDARMGDGLFDIHIALAGLDLAAFDWIGHKGERHTHIEWSVGFEVFDETYRVRWEMRQEPEDPGVVFNGCQLLKLEEEGERAIALPLCTFDEANATLSADIPERSVGSPGPGVPFTGLWASSAMKLVVPGPDAWDTEDRLDRPRYAFALGGPAVWSLLNPRLDPPAPPAPQPWYEDPFSEDNLPDTLQVLGALGAGATFLGGLLLMVRRRRQTRRLLERVDEIERDGRVDSSGTLVALGRLEDEFRGMFRKGRITDGQYQVLSQRIASVATRFALRRELGLDDGVPGEGGPARRVPLRVDPDLPEPGLVEP